MDVLVEEKTIKLPKKLLHALQILANSAASEVFQDLPRCFQALLVVPNYEISNTIKSIHNTHGNQDIRLLTKTNSSAVALPVESKNELKCWVVVERRLCDQLIGSMDGANDLYLTLLEELFHINNYENTWNRRGYIGHQSENKCANFFQNISYKLLDEYIAGRNKANLLAQRSVKLGFGKSLPSLITNSVNNLFKTIDKFASGQIEFDEASSRINSIIIKDIFESMARESGRRAPYPHTKPPLGDPNESEEYKLLIKSFWEAVETQLINAHNDENKFEQSEREISKLLELFYNQVGITFKTIESGECWMTITDSWINKRRSHE